MKKTIKLLVITIIVAMLMPFTIVNATTSRTEEIVESLKESAKSYNGTVNYEGNTIEIEWNIPNSKSNTIQFSYANNVIEYNQGKITSYEQAEDVVTHSLFAIYLIKSALRLNGYTDAKIQEFLSSEDNEFDYEINGIEFKQTGEQQKFTSKDEGTITIAPVSIKIDVTKANLNTSSDEPVTVKSTTIEDIIENLQSDSDFTTSEDEGKVIIENEISSEDNTITISNTYYMDEYHNVFFNCENDIITYEDEDIETYYEAERAGSHQMFAIQILTIALKKNGYTNNQIQEFLSSEDNEFNYELNGIELKEIGKEKEFTSEDESSKVTVTPMSIKIDLAKANLKKANESEEKANQDETKEMTEYKVLEGAGQTVEISKNKETTFRFNVEYLKFKENGKVYIDGQLADNKNYTSKEGSTIITFKEDYIKNLSVGEHTLKVAVADGEVSTTFKIANNMEIKTPKTTITTKPNNPKTGDDIIIVFSVFVVATFGAFSIVKLNTNNNVRKY